MAKIPIMAIAIMGKLVPEVCNELLNNEFGGLVIGESACGTCELWIK